jgi:phosphomevalonate kinase
MDIVSPPHAELGRLAAAHGLAYKPSGAGGGDVGLLFALSADALAQSVREAERAGYGCVPLLVHPDGVRLR